MNSTKAYCVCYKLFGILLLALLILAPHLRPPSASAASSRFSTSGTLYYVAPHGDDKNSGSEAQPWRTLARAAGAAAAGDTVYIKAGTYHEILAPQHSGTADKPITFAAAPGESAIIDGEAGKAGDFGGLVDIVGKSYITIEGLQIVNSPFFGIRVQDSQYVTIRNNQTDFTYSSGVYVDGSRHVLIDGNDIQRACHGVGGSPPHFTPNEHLTIRNTSDFEVMNNRVHNSFVIDGEIRGKEGINIKSGSASGSVHHNIVNGIDRTGIYVDGYDKSVRNVAIYNNQVSNSQHGITIASERQGPVDDIHIYNNLFVDNKYHGIWLADHGQAGPLHNISVVNNTVYGNGGFGLRISSQALSQILVRNNIFSHNQNGGIRIDSDANSAAVTLDHNLETDDPGFVDPSQFNFRLRGQSSAIDKGSYTGAPGHDADGLARPQGAGIDIGSYELAAASTTVPSAFLFMPLLSR